MAEENGNVKVMTGEEFALYAARPATRLTGILLALLAVAVYLGFRDGFGGRAGLLIVSALVAWGGMFVFQRQLHQDAVTGSAERSLRNMARSFGGFLPYLLGLYLVLVEGFWTLRTVSESFSARYILGRLLFIYLGYRLVSWTYQLSKIGRSIDSGAIVIEDVSNPAGTD